MANPTTNYGFVLPTSTDLVTDLPADFDVALQGVDTRLKALQPGTTLGDLMYASATANTNTRLGIGSNGQVLSISGGVPAWATTADQTPLTTKGDLFTFTTVDARLGIGANNTILTADSAEATGMKWATPAAAPGWTLLSTTSLTGASVTISSISQSYNELMISVEDYFPATDGSLYFQLNANAGANLHNRFMTYAQGATTGTNLSLGTEAYWTFGSCDNVDNNNACVINLPAYANTTSRKMFSWSAEFQNNTPARELTFGTGGFNSTSAISSIKIGTTTTWSQGTVKIYGC